MNINRLSHGDEVELINAGESSRLSGRSFSESNSNFQVNRARGGPDNEQVLKGAERNCGWKKEDL